MKIKIEIYLYIRNNKNSCEPKSTIKEEGNKVYIRQRNE